MDDGSAVVDKVLYNCIYHPRGLGGQSFRDDPVTRNTRWVKIDYSTSRSGFCDGQPVRSRSE